MKKIIYSLSAAALLLAASSCGKEHQCKCVFPDLPDEPNEYNVFVVEGIDCEDITEMAYEHAVHADGGGYTLERYDVRKVECRSHGN